MSEGRLLTVPEVAERLRTNPETVRRWLRQGKLRGFRPGGTKLGYRIPEPEVAILTKSMGYIMREPSAEAGSSPAYYSSTSHHGADPYQNASPSSYGMDASSGQSIDLQRRIDELMATARILVGRMVELQSDLERLQRDTATQTTARGRA